MYTFDVFRLVECTLLAYVALLATATPAARASLRQLLRGMAPAVRIGIATALTLGLVSAAWAPSFPLAANDWGHAALWIAGVCGLTALLDAPALRTLVRSTVVLILACVVALFVIALAKALHTGDSEQMTRWWLVFTNPRFVSQILVWTVPLACVLPLHPGSPMSSAARRASAVLAALGFLLMFWAGGRGALIGIVLACGLCGWLCRDAPLRALASVRVLSCFAAGGLLYLAFPWLMSRLGLSEVLGEALLRGGLSNRDLLWTRSLGDLWAHPLLGAGPGHYAIYKAADHVMQAHPHNAILQWAGEWGLPAAAGFSIAWLVLLLRLGREVARRARPAAEAAGDAAYGQALFISVAAASFLAVFDGVLVMPWSLLLGLLICSLSIRWVLAGTDGPVAASTAPGDRRMAVVFGVFTVAAVAATAIGAWQVRPCAYRQTGALPLDKPLSPRFWIDGQFTIGQPCNTMTAPDSPQPAPLDNR